MKIRNFKLIRTEGIDVTDRVFVAEVDVTTGMFWRRKTIRREIRREYCGRWYFSDTGEYTSGLEVEALARAWTAQTGEKT